MSFQLIMCWKRSVGRLSTKKLHKFYSTLSLMSNENNYDQHYYSSHQNQYQILTNIRLRRMEDQFKELFDGNTPKDKQLLSDAILRNIDSMPNKLDPIWYNTILCSQLNYMFAFI